MKPNNETAEANIALICIQLLVSVILYNLDGCNVLALDE